MLYCGATWDISKPPFVDIRMCEEYDCVELEWPTSVMGEMPKHGEDVMASVPSGSGKLMWMRRLIESCWRRGPCWRRGLMGWRCCGWELQRRLRYGKCGSEHGSLHGWATSKRMDGQGAFNGDAWGARNQLIQDE